ncbi:hypothetical protein PCC6912_01470 [Chlorogloeopsis fritschii PCC 6912]|uniref:NnrU domain-containing protein n=2 Tax=Chlorogloeopsis fritschii TaxID=1124 RepID=A0A3S5K2I9_CHLFR|nr:hypothetical protein PCC6912_01470 [Chlorogloeopsis fritschii PCC 6912]
MFMMLPPWLTTSHFTILGLQLGFAIAHSGGAALRPWAEKRIGPRLYRIMFALTSLPLAVILIIYFFNHRYDGLQLWQIQSLPGVKPLVWILSAISFLFLYPATFNLLEIAAITKPQVHLYETGIIRITRHPQMVGQIIWCVAHTLWLGTTFTVVTSAGLILHHLFGVWHGDRRLSWRYGTAFTAVKQRTSIIPFAAIVDGRQHLEWREFFRPAYLGVAIFVILLWWSHPLLLTATSKVQW